MVNFVWDWGRGWFTVFVLGGLGSKGVLGGWKGRNGAGGTIGGESDFLKKKKKINEN